MQAHGLIDTVADTYAGFAIAIFGATEYFGAIIGYFTNYGTARSVPNSSSSQWVSLAIRLLHRSTILTTVETPSDHCWNFRRRVSRSAHLCNGIATHPREARQKTRSQNCVTTAKRRQGQRETSGARDDRNRDTAGHGAREKEHRALPITLEPVHNEEKFQPAVYSLHSTSSAGLVRRIQHHRVRSTILWDPWCSRQPGETVVHGNHRDRQARSSNSLRNFCYRPNRPSEIANDRSKCAVALHFLHRRSAVCGPGACGRRIHAWNSSRWHQCHCVDVPLRRWLCFRLELTLLHHHLRDLSFADAHSRNSCRDGRALWQSVWLTEGGAADAARKLNASTWDVLVLLGDYVSWNLLGVGLVARDGQYAVGESGLYTGGGGSERRSVERRT